MLTVLYVCYCLRPFSVANTFSVTNVPASVMFLVVLLFLASLLLLLVHGVPNISPAVRYKKILVIFKSLIHEEFVLTHAFLWNIL